MKPPRDGVGIGPQRSEWISSKTDFDLCSLEGKGHFMIFPRAHPLHVPI